MKKVIGPARDFWRLRLTRMDATGDVDFTWNDDVLYRAPDTSVADGDEEWHVEAVSLDDAERVVRLASFTDREGADAFMETAHEHLDELTRSQFEQAYFDEDEQA